MPRARVTFVSAALALCVACGPGLEEARSQLAGGRASQAVEAALAVAESGFLTGRRTRAEALRIAGDGYLSLGQVGMGLAHLGRAIDTDRRLRDPICAAVRDLAARAVVDPEARPLAVTLVSFLRRHGCADPALTRFWEVHRPRADNFVLLGVDTVRADHLGCYGYPVPTSPSIDRLAGRSLRFERAFTASPWTCPSFLSMFTGVPPLSHGVYHYPRPRHIPSGMPTLWSLLHDAGFATASFTEGGYAGPGYGLEIGFDVRPGDPYGGTSRSERVGSPVRLAANVERTVEFIERSRGARFAVWFHTYQAHLPMDPPADLVTLIGTGWREATQGLVPPDRDLGQDRLERWRVERGFKGTLPSKSLHDHIIAYDATIRSVDGAVGAIVDALDELGLSDRTLVVFLSDHGEGLTEHGLLDHGQNLYRELMQIPLLWSMPGLAPGAVEDPVSTMGLANTVLWALGLGADRIDTPFSGAYGALTGSPRRNDPFEGALLMQGLATAGGELDRSAALCWPHHLIVHSDGGGELYDLDADPGELHDLWGALPEPAARCHRQWSSMWAASLELAERFGVDHEAPPEQLDGAARRRLQALGYVE